MDRAFLRVMTYNIHGGLDRLGRPSLLQAGETIARSGAALAGLQEVELAFRARSGFADQPAILSASLGLDCRFAPALDRKPGARGSKFGNALLSVWPVLRSWSYPLPGRGEPRVLLAGLVETPEGRIHFLVTHLGLDSLDRALQVRTIMAHAAPLPGPLILAGDLNAPPGAPELAPLFAVWQEAQTAAGLDLPTFPPAGARIDYLFFSSHWRIRAARVVPSPASDHWPLVADAEL
ncbi:MAG: endonuclease/exonuclease/phosphatase family protein [Patescibacteria group bacterium]